MISRSTLEAANRVAQYAAQRPIALALSALSTAPAVDEPICRRDGLEHFGLVAGTSQQGGEP